MKNANKIREHDNRYWLLNDEVYELHFTQFYDDEIILKFIETKKIQRITFMYRNY